MCLVVKPLITSRTRYKLILMKKTVFVLPLWTGSSFGEWLLFWPYNWRRGKPMKLLWTE